MIENQCKDCRWLERYEGEYICGYIADVYLIASKVKPESPCKTNKYEKKGRKTWQT